MSPERLSRHLALASAALLGVACAGNPSGQGLPTTDGRLVGAFDMHAHTAPDSRPRSVTDRQLAELAIQAGMAGFVLKNHFAPTAARAALLTDEFEDLEVFGGIVLNRAVGGLNAEAVRQLASFSGLRGKVVWLPTVDAEYVVSRNRPGDPYVPVLVDGMPAPGLEDVLRTIAAHDLVLATGHSSADDSVQIVTMARSFGVSRIVVTHAVLQNASTEQMRAMADEGAVLELCWYQVLIGRLDIRSYAQAVHDIGAEHFVMSTDLGQADRPDHVSGMSAFVAAMRGEGIADEDIHRMVSSNPARVMGSR